MQEEEAACNYAFTHCTSVTISAIHQLPPPLPVPSHVTRVFHLFSPSKPLILHVAVHFLPLLPTLTPPLPSPPTRRESKGRLSSLSYLDAEDDAFVPLVTSPRTRTLPERSYTIDTPYTSSEAKKTTLTPSNDATDGSASTASRSPVPRSHSPAAAPLPSSPSAERTTRVRTEESTTGITSSSPVRKPVEARYPLSRNQAVEEVSTYRQQQQPQPSSMEAKPPATSRVSASLPRSYQKSESSRLSSVVTPRPFGTQPSSITSLPRASTVSIRWMDRWIDVCFPSWFKHRSQSNRKQSHTL